MIQFATVSQYYELVEKPLDYGNDTPTEQKRIFWKPSFRKDIIKYYRLNSLDEYEFSIKNFVSYNNLKLMFAVKDY